MKIQDYKVISKTGTGFRVKTLASVTKTTGMLFWKKKETVKIVHDGYGCMWKFADTGKFLPKGLLSDLSI